MMLRTRPRLGSAGATYSFEKMDVFGTYVHYATGTDTHSGRAFTFGVSVPFRVGNP